VAAALNTIKIRLRIGRKLDAAQDYFGRALAIRRRSLGPAHPSTAASLVSLPRLAILKGELSKAEGFYRRSETVHRKARGQKSPRRLKVLRRLGDLAALQTRYKRTEALCTEV